MAWRNTAKLFQKTFTKWIDPGGPFRLGSPRRHEGGRRERLQVDCGAKAASLKELLKATPDRLFSPLETSSLIVWLSRQRASSRDSQGFRKKSSDKKLLFAG